MLREKVNLKAIHDTKKKYRIILGAGKHLGGRMIFFIFKFYYLFVCVCMYTCVLVHVLRG